MSYTIRLAIFLILISQSRFANAYQLLDLEELSMTHARLGDASRDPLAPQYSGDWLYKTSLMFRFNVLGPLYWDNRVHTEATNGGVRTVGWWWMLGLRIHPNLDIFHEHHSRHIMDESSPNAILYGNKSRNFPVEDSYGIKLNIYKGRNGWSILE